MNPETNSPNQKTKRIKPRDLTVILLYIVFLAGLVAGIIWNNGLLKSNEISEETFRHRMLFVGLCVLWMAGVFLIELILRVRLPLFVEITLMTFAFLATALSTVFGFYGLIPSWDTIMHTASGFIFSICGLCLAHLVFRDRLKGTFQTVIFLLFAFLFALAVGYVWELFEFTGDSIMKDSNLQGYNNDFVKKLEDGTYIKNSLRGSGLIDTMTDMFVNFGGAAVFFIGMLVLFLKKPAALNAFRPVVYPWWTQVIRERRAKKNANPPEKKDDV